MSVIIDTAASKARRRRIQYGFCPSYDRGCYACYGPMESPNIASLTSQLRILGQSDEQVVRAFRGFNAWAWQFRKASEECERK
jgi:sulfhydrogenase subunit delta